MKNRQDKKEQNEQNTTKDKVVCLLQSIKRNGMNNVIAKLDSVGYFKSRNYGHHTYDGGTVDHSLEVYDYMSKHISSPSYRDSMIIVSLFHDLGKCVGRAAGYGGGGHGSRSVAMLERWGLELNSEERDAIIHHHNWKSINDIVSIMKSPLRRYLSLGDCASTGAWKRNHRR